MVPVLRDISVCIPRGALTLVLGATGGGKTSLLTALMGEIHTTQGISRDKTRDERGIGEKREGREGKADSHTDGGQRSISHPT